MKIVTLDPKIYVFSKDPAVYRYNGKESWLIAEQEGRVLPWVLHHCFKPPTKASDSWIYMSEHELLKQRCDSCGREIPSCLLTSYRLLYE